MANLRVMSAFDLCGEDPSLWKEGERHYGLQVSRTKPTRRERSDELTRLVEGEIIPRLMLVHQAQPQSVESSEKIPLGPEATEKFCEIALSRGHDSLLAVIGNLLQQGVSMETLYLDLMAPAARRLGEYWSEDSVSFADVTIALGRLQQVVRELSLYGPLAEGSAHPGRAALFAAAPGEQHTFGLVIIEEFFRRSGWRTWTELSGEVEAVSRAAHSHAFDIFGMTASCDTQLDQLAPMIMSVRRASRNRDISVIVGGRLFLERPELVARVGADGMATDAREAVLKAEGAVRQLARF